jgi:hypothetical protein
MRGTKRAQSPSKKGSPSLSSAPTPPLASSGTLSPLGSSLEVSSRYPRSPVFEQGGSSGKAPVVDLSSSLNEEGLIPDTSRDEEFIEDSSVTSTVTFLGCPTMARSSSLVTPMRKKRRYMRRKLPAPKLRLLLL